MYWIGLLAIVSIDIVGKAPISHWWTLVPMGIACGVWGWTTAELGNYRRGLSE